VPVFCVKHRNAINEPLFVPSDDDEESLNPYAKLIVDEARRRGIHVNIVDGPMGYFDLNLGGRSITCRESLSEMTTAVAMSRCDDKRVTYRLLSSAGIHMPKQLVAAGEDENLAFLDEHGAIVVKPARGEQGNGISVDVRTPEHLSKAIDNARRVCNDVLLEQKVDGSDLRLVVIDNQVVAAALRKPATLIGDGKHTIRKLIEKYNRRRMAATGGESRVPLDDETERCVRAAGYGLDDVLPLKDQVVARNTANLHTGGTIHDVTEEIHPDLAAVARKAALTLDIPVTGIDLMVPDHTQPDYHFIEANERPGLANHEPQPTAQRFIDFLFPQTAKR